MYGARGVMIYMCSGEDCKRRNTCMRYLLNNADNHWFRMSPATEYGETKKNWICKYRIGVRKKFEYRHDEQTIGQ